MSWKRVGVIALWVVLAIAPGGFWAMAAWASYRAARPRLATAPRTSEPTRLSCT